MEEWRKALAGLLGGVTRRSGHRGAQEARRRDGMTRAGVRGADA